MEQNFDIQETVNLKVEIFLVYLRMQESFHLSDSFKMVINIFCIIFVILFLMSLTGTFKEIKLPEFIKRSTKLTIIYYTVTFIILILLFIYVQFKVYL